jgi:hypothetical protein
MLWLSRRIAAPGPYLALCANEKTFNKALRHCGVLPGAARFLKSSHANATTHWLENKSGDLVCIVCLGDTQGRNSIEIAGLLVHEAVHVWQRYCERIGEERPGEEQEAYAIQSIAQELMAAFADQMISPDGQPAPVPDQTA